MSVYKKPLYKKLLDNLAKNKKLQLVNLEGT